MFTFHRLIECSLLVILSTKYLRHLHLVNKYHIVFLMCVIRQTRAWMSYFKKMIDFTLNLHKMEINVTIHCSAQQLGTFDDKHLINSHFPAVQMGLLSTCWASLSGWIGRHKHFPSQCLKWLYPMFYSRVSAQINIINTA